MGRAIPVRIVRLSLYQTALDKMIFQSGSLNETVSYIRVSGERVSTVAVC